MPKLKKGLVKEAKKNRVKREQQKRLHDKYHANENVVIVEKSNTFKFTIATVQMFFKVCAAILIVILAAIGVSTLLYPSLRIEFIKICQEFLQQINLVKAI